jgi:hypothetical protein
LGEFGRAWHEGKVGSSQKLSGLKDGHPFFFLRKFMLTIEIEKN